MRNKPYSGRDPKRESSKDNYGKRGDDNERKTFKRSDKPFDKKPDFKKSDKPYSGRGPAPRAEGTKAGYGKRDDDTERKPFKRSDKPFDKKPGFKRDDSKSDRPYTGRTPREGDSERKPYERKTGFKRDDSKSERPYSSRAPREGDSERKPYERKPSFKRDDSKGERPYPKRESREGDSERKPYERKTGFKRDDSKSDRPYSSRAPREGDSERKPYERKTGFKRDDSKSDRPYSNRAPREGDSERKPYPKREPREGDSERKPYERKTGFQRDDSKGDRPYPKREPREGDSERKPFKRSDKPFDRKPTFKKADDPFDKPFPLGTRKVSGPFRKKFQEEKEGKPQATKPERTQEEKEAELDKEMTLNKYISHSGECSRREAAALVKQGKVKVNGELALDPGYRVQPEDRVTIAGKKLTPQRDFVYVLLNKPKGFITTTEDPQERKTVMELVSGVEAPRVYPVGRLDRNTTGLLLLTNDGDLAQKLSHPSYEVKKVYQVTLDKSLTKIDFDKILAGITLDDGEVKVDSMSYLEAKHELGLEIHNGRNRIVRRIFESLGYEVEKLDRVMYAGLTKKNLPRGKWRLLTDREIILLKHFKG